MLMSSEKEREFCSLRFGRRDGVSELRTLPISASASRSELRRGSGEDLGSSAVVNLTGLVTAEARRGERREERGAGAGAI